MPLSLSDCKNLECSKSKLRRIRDMLQWITRVLDSDTNAAPGEVHYPNTCPISVVQSCFVANACLTSGFPPTFSLIEVPPAHILQSFRESRWPRMDDMSSHVAAAV